MGVIKTSICHVAPKHLATAMQSHANGVLHKGHYTQVVYGNINKWKAIYWTNIELPKRACL